MKHADERRTLAADGDVVAAEIADDAHAGLLGEQPGIADLPANQFARDVADRVTVEADEVRSFDRFLRQRAQEFGDGFGMMQRDVAFDAGEFEQRHVVLRGFENARAEVAIVGQREAAEELDCVLAVGGDQGDVGPVGGRAAHQSQGLL